MRSPIPLVIGMFYFEINNSASFLFTVELRHHWRMSQERPPHRFAPVTTEWIARVEAELERRGMTHRDLCRSLNVTDQAVAAMLSGKSRSSRLVEATTELLAIPPSHYKDELDQEAHELFSELRDLDRTAFDRVMAVLKRELKLSCKD